MSRIKITEFRAKTLLLGDLYQGSSVTSTIPALKKSERYVVKVDQGIKKRFKQGLVAVNKEVSEIPAIIESWRKKGFSKFLIEPFMPHEEKEEQYFSLERVREGIRLLHAKEGGIDIEAHPEAVTNVRLSGPKDVTGAAKKMSIPENFLKHVLKVFDDNYFAFLEINPLVVRGDSAIPLDAAVLVDSAAAFFVHDWGENDVTEGKARYDAEERVQNLQKTTPASLKLTVLHPDGSLFFLLSGGGGSIVIADEAELRGAGTAIGNYGEYSGGPSREETHLYTREVLELLLESPAKKKALIIAGGVANFTDIKSTFAGIIDALREKSAKLRDSGMKVFVRRGGPNEEAGLTHMREYLTSQNLLGTIHGSDAAITAAVDDAITFVQL